MSAELKEEEYLNEDDTAEPEPVTTETPPTEKKKSGRSIRSEAQLKALERGRQRRMEKADAERNAKELKKAKEVLAEQPKEPVVQEPVVEKPPESVVVKPPKPPEPPKPRIERQGNRFHLF